MLFCFAFYGVAGVASEAPIFSVTIVAQILVCALLLGRQKVITYETGPEADWTLNSGFARVFRILILFSMPFFFFLAIHGIPALSTRPEVSRVEFSNSISIYDRIYPVVFYLLILLSFLGVSSAKTWLKKSKFILVMFFILLAFILSGYRARAVDGFILLAIAAAVSRQGGKSKIGIKALLRLSGIGSIVLLIGLIPAVYLTMIRFETQDWRQGIELVYWRVFEVNYETNIPRIDHFVSTMGIGYGEYYFRDLLSVFVKSMESSQVFVTSYFNSQGGVFVMTTTFLGEAILNFGRSFLLLSIVPFLLLVSLNRVVLKSLSAPAIHHHFELSINLLSLYYIARIVPTGGVSNAFVTKLLPLYIVITLVVFCFFVLSGKIRIRKT
ncbi:hypothetical protein [Shimia sediminis]|uniref:hypothetical protein n=1 Tax=Shimia sediminis TaxID=2497945 RepID=UPI000F8D78E5|nr:hypothetical protein [Shimia sediminis]